ncbi:putative inactive receptor-like protein kinase at1g64210 [Phtheirospermum japonicum]|uniref:Putative inactive receptor-like protein kinase at1g64210 n=1 Tax=Phtheirospermum japonicum TaxID=374723 RepID=A0A830BRJ4_9LAMI|nr:putative inactive receptor-like protein kinase at1g64210 [Phtheirospermum japonicum]
MRISTSTISLFITISLSIPCIIIAFEFFPDERNALMQLRDAVSSTSDLHLNWTGPPCIKNQSRWTGIACSDWHVTHLVLEGIQLTGSLPSMFLHNLTSLTKLSFGNNSLHGPLPNLTNLMNLEIVFLSRNHFSGPIPSGYVDLPKLIELELQENDLWGQIPPFNQRSLIAFNVSNNQLEGPIPQTPVLQRFTNGSYADNPALCGGNTGLLSPCSITVLPLAPAIAPPPSPVPPRDDGGLKVWSVALIAAAAALVPLIFLSYYYFYRRSVYGEKPKKDNEQEESRGTRSHWSESTDDDQERSMELEFLDNNNNNNNNKPFFDLDDLLCAAAEEIGRGKLGPTYKAMLECGSVVAVKRLEETNASKKEFVQQMRLLGNIKHENLAKIISFHHSKEEKMIVYEYVPDPSLFSLLHGENRGNISTRLDWKTRVSIIEETAKAMDFLHNHKRLASQRVPHGNLKSSNVLIQHVDINIRVKLTDYGFCPIVPAHKLSVGKTPEFGEGNKNKKLTRKADVYCFGILVLEVVTGKVPLSPNLSSSSSPLDIDLSGWVKEAVSNEWSTDILDAEILGEREGYDDMLRLMEIALECTDDLPERRPNMGQVLRKLHDMQHISS